MSDVEFVEASNGQVASIHAHLSDGHLLLLCADGSVVTDDPRDVTPLEPWQVLRPGMRLKHKVDHWPATVVHSAPSADVPVVLSTGAASWYTTANAAEVLDACWIEVWPPRAETPEPPHLKPGDLVMAPYHPGARRGAKVIATNVGKWSEFTDVRFHGDADTFRRPTDSIEHRSHAAIVEGAGHCPRCRSDQVPRSNLGATACPCGWRSDGDNCAVCHHRTIQDYSMSLGLHRRCEACGEVA